MAGEPILRAFGLCLVPFGERHLTQRYVGWLNDPDVVRYSEQRHRRHSMESCKGYVRSFTDGPSLLWAIEVEARSGLHIGNISAKVDAPNCLADISILIGDAASWGHGFGFAAWSMVLDYLCGREDIDIVTGGCIADNHAMVHIMQKAGMEPDGRRPEHYLLDGERVDIIYMAKRCDS